MANLDSNNNSAKNHTKPWRKPLVIMVFVAIAFIAVVGLQLRSTGSTSDTSENTSLRLKWINQAQFSGYYMASKNGHYKDAGLDVQIDPAGPNISPTQMVTSGVNEFGIAGADEIIQAQAKGVPLVALAVIFQYNPEALTSLKDSGIKEPGDLSGKRVGVIYGNDENLYREFLKRNNIDSATITEVAAVPGASQLLSGEVDAIMAYSMNVPVLLNLQGYETNVMEFVNYGVEFYGDTLFTTQDMLENYPDKVNRFVQASIQGWKDAASHPVDAVNEVIRINPSLDREAQAGYLNGVIPILTHSNVDIGSFKNSTWKHMQDTLYELGAIDKKFDITTIYSDRFLQE